MSTLQGYKDEEANDQVPYVNCKPQIVSTTLLIQNTAVFDWGGCTGGGGGGGGGAVLTPPHYSLDRHFAGRLGGRNLLRLGEHLLLWNDILRDTRLLCCLLYAAAWSVNCTCNMNTSKEIPSLPFFVDAVSPLVCDVCCFTVTGVVVTVYNTMMEEDEEVMRRSLCS